MLTLSINETLTVTLYDSIKELPANRQLDAKQYAILQSALATSAGELTNRHERMELLLAYDLQADYQTERFNYELSVHLMEQGFHPAELEWACYISTINGDKVDDYSEDALIERVASLKQQGLTSEQIDSSLAEINQALLAEVKRYYPNRAQKGLYNTLQRQLHYGVALANYFESDDEETKQKLDKITLSVLTAQKPLNLRDEPENVLVSLEKSQFKLYTRLQEAGCRDIDNLTVYQFYGWLDVLEERNKQQTDALTKKAPGRKSV